MSDSELAAPDGYAGHGAKEQFAMCQSIGWRQAFPPEEWTRSFILPCRHCGYTGKKIFMMVDPNRTGILCMCKYCGTENGPRARIGFLLNEINGNEERDLARFHNNRISEQE